MFNCSWKLSFDPVITNHIKLWTNRNPLLSKIVHYIQCGWTGDNDHNLMDDLVHLDELIPFERRRLDLSVLQDSFLL